MRGVATASEGSTQTRAFRFLVCPLVWGAALGGVGFVCGFIGPIVLNPSANQGPLLGIFITGPVGCVCGLFFGLVAATLGLSVRANICCLSVTSFLAATVVLYMSTPESRYRGTVIDAEVRGCRDPALLIADSTGQWEEWVSAKPSWREIRPNWKQDVGPMLKEKDGVVLDLHVFAETKIYENRKPWNRGTLSITPWSHVGTSKAHFAREAGSSCDNYSVGERKLYFVVWEASSVWPPDTLPSFLRLHVAGEVPDEYADIVTR